MCSSFGNPASVPMHNMKLPSYLICIYHLPADMQGLGTSRHGQRFGSLVVRASAAGGGKRITPDQFTDKAWQVRCADVLSSLQERR